MKILSRLFHPQQPDTRPLPAKAAKAPPSQPVDKMLKTLAEAERLGLRTWVDEHGNLKLSEHSRSLWGWIRVLFTRQPVGIENRETIVAAVINRMKTQVGQTTRHVDQVITCYLPALDSFKQSGKIGDLRDQWAALTNIQTRGFDVHERVMEARKDRGDTGVEAAPPPATTAATTATTTATTRAQDVDDELHALLDEANRSLPKAMPAITCAGQTFCCTLTVPDSKQQGLFDDWRTWSIHAKDLLREGPDPYVGLSEAFSKDAERAIFVFEKDGFAMECERDSEAVAIGFKDAVGKNPMRREILSHLLGQEALKRMLEAIQTAHPRADGEWFHLGGVSDPLYTRHRLHLTVHDNGDVDIDYQSLMKKTKLLGDIDLIDINEGPKFDGPPTRDNSGACLTMKIRLPNANLNRGELRFLILEPLQMRLQIEIPARTPKN